jgi:cytochrome c peroxidase
MPPRLAALAAFIMIFASGCQDSIVNPGATGLPQVVSANDVVGISVGDPIAYDATRGGTAFSDPSGRGLTYTLTLSGSAAGLRPIGGVVAGSPTTPGLVVATLTATDAQGGTAVDQFVMVVFAAGMQTPVLPATPFRYADSAVPLPASFRALVNGASVVSADNTPLGNPITDAGATLGRVLFYDPRLSKNDVTPSSSCHIQSLGFSDALRLSVGFAGGQTARHSPGLANARFYAPGRFFWDERAATLEDQVLGPIQSPVEMGMALDTLVLKLRATPFYTTLFTAAFGTPEITSDRISRALAEFVRSFTSAGSRYDLAVNGTAPLTAQEQQGEQLFRTAGCAQCHTTVAQVSDAAHNIGLDAVNSDVGTGRGAVKVPSLRNVAVRPRYMHDGRFTTLEQVVDFFDSGVRPNPDLDPRLEAADGTPRRLGLTAAQKAAVVAFLKTLTDPAFLSDVRLSDPFAATVALPAPPIPAPPTPTTPAPPAPPPAPLAATITLQGNAYHPALITVARGATLTFTNLDNRRHSASFASSAITSTPIFTTGSQTVKMPTVAGTYAYQCAVHGAAMSGTIVVQ